METQLPQNFLLINKPAGWTSFDVVNFIRKKARQETGNKNIKVGHAGTLDPFATGLLIVGVGREATKHLDNFKNLSKTYVAKVHLGAMSDTGDVTGVIKQQAAAQAEPHLEAVGTTSKPPQERGPASGRWEQVNGIMINSVLKTFVGKQLQVPPMHSAKKIQGTRLYTLARQGIEIKRQPNEIQIYHLSLIAYEWPHLTIEVECSAGTYIRTLAEDIGKKLGVGAYCEELTRTKIGPYTLDKATSIPPNYA